ELRINEECKKYMKEIISILENTKGIVFDKNYDVESIDNDRDKDIIISRDHIGVMVTNKNYSKNAKNEAKNMNIILCQTQNLIKNINKEINYRKKLITQEKETSCELVIE
ncbi:15707_t:CDS:2, partial [Cetraspora pellucida]